VPSMPACCASAGYSGVTSWMTRRSIVSAGTFTCGFAIAVPLAGAFPSNSRQPRCQCHPPIRAATTVAQTAIETMRRMPNLYFELSESLKSTGSLGSATSVPTVAPGCAANRISPSWRVDRQTEKLEAKTLVPLIAYDRRGPHRRAHVRNKKLNADRLAHQQLRRCDNPHSALTDLDGAS